MLITLIEKYYAHHSRHIQFCASSAFISGEILFLSKAFQTAADGAIGHRPRRISRFGFCAGNS
jgi:hypothetical protein